MTEVTKLTKKSKNVLLTIVGVAIIAAGLFYWFQVRPSTIRSECADIARTKTIKSEGSMKYYEFHYDFCLNERGLK